MEKFKLFIKKIFHSLDRDSKNGFSARKLTALAIMILIGIGHIKFYNSCNKNGDFNLWVQILFIDYIMVSVCLGLTTWENYHKNKSDKKEDESSL